MIPTLLSARDVNTTTLETVFQDAVNIIGDVGVSANYALDILSIETPLWGMFTILILLSTWILFDKGLRSTSHRIMLLVTVIMYGASTAHWALILRRATSFPRALARQENLITSSSQACLEAVQSDTPCELFVFKSAPHAGELTSCGPTSLITLNLILSDSIVLWRAWILWSRNRVIQVVSVVFVLATLGLSLADISDACTTYDGSVFEGSKIGLAALTMSLVTNLWATTLIGIKAWGHRRLIRKHIQSGSSKTQVEKMMALLVESGVIYCCVWILLVVFNSIVVVEGFAVTGPNLLPSSPRQNFIRAIDKFLEGGMFQVIGIYPTLIIVLVCLQKTHCDRNFTYDTPRAPQISLRDIRVTVDTETTAAESHGRVYALDPDGCYGMGELPDGLRCPDDGDSILERDVGKEADVKGMQTVRVRLCG